MVGESEANVRALFAEAEAEEKQMGANRYVASRFLNLIASIISMVLIFDYTVKAELMIETRRAFGAYFP